MPNNTEVKSNRERYTERLKAKYPDREFADDEALFGQINDDYDGYDKELSGYKEREKALSDLFASNPQSAAFLTDWRKGEDPIIGMVRKFGDDFKAALEDPEKQEALAAANKEFAERIAQEKDMLIREVREKLEAHGYDIAEKNLRILLEDKKFFAKTGKRWLLSQRMIDRGYARYRYRNDDEFYGTNTVYVTPKGFQWIVSKISKEWMPRFLELKGRVLSRSDKDIFAKR